MGDRESTAPQDIPATRRRTSRLLNDRTNRSISDSSDHSSFDSPSSGSPWAVLRVQPPPASINGKQSIRNNDNNKNNNNNNNNQETALASSSSAQHYFPLEFSPASHSSNAVNELNSSLSSHHESLSSGRRSKSRETLYSGSEDSGSVLGPRRGNHSSSLSIPIVTTSTPSTTTTSTSSPLTNTTKNQEDADGKNRRSGSFDSKHGSQHGHTHHHHNHHNHHNHGREPSDVSAVMVVPYGRTRAGSMSDLIALSSSAPTTTRRHLPSPPPTSVSTPPSRSAQLDAEYSPSPLISALISPLTTPSTSRRVPEHAPRRPPYHDLQTGTGELDSSPGASSGPTTSTTTTISDTDDTTTTNHKKTPSQEPPDVNVSSPPIQAPRPRRGHTRTHSEPLIGRSDRLRLQLPLSPLVPQLGSPSSPRSITTLIPGSGSPRSAVIHSHYGAPIQSGVVSTGSSPSSQDGRAGKALSNSTSAPSLTIEQKGSPGNDQYLSVGDSSPGSSVSTSALTSGGLGWPSSPLHRGPSASSPLAAPPTVVSTDATLLAKLAAAKSLADQEIGHWRGIVNEESESRGWGLAPPTYVAEAVAGIHGAAGHLVAASVNELRFGYLKEMVVALVGMHVPPTDAGMSAAEEAGASGSVDEAETARARGVEDAAVVNAWTAKLLLIIAQTARLMEALEWEMSAPKEELERGAVSPLSRPPTLVPLGVAATVLSPMLSAAFVNSPLVSPRSVSTTGKGSVPSSGRSTPPVTSDIAGAAAVLVSGTSTPASKASMTPEPSPRGVPTSLEVLNADLQQRMSTSAATALAETSSNGGEGAGALLKSASMQTLRVGITSPNSKSTLGASPTRLRSLGRSPSRPSALPAHMAAEAEPLQPSGRPRRRSIGASNRTGAAAAMAEDTVVCRICEQPVRSMVLPEHSLLCATRAEAALKAAYYADRLSRLGKNLLARTSEAPSSPRNHVVCDLCDSPFPLDALVAHRKICVGTPSHSPKDGSVNSSAGSNPGTPPDKGGLWLESAGVLSPDSGFKLQDALAVVDRTVLEVLAKAVTSAGALSVEDERSLRASDQVAEELRDLAAASPETQQQLIAAAAGLVHNRAEMIAEYLNTSTKLLEVGEGQAEGTTTPPSGSHAVAERNARSLNSTPKMTKKGRVVPSALHLKLEGVLRAAEVASATASAQGSPRSVGSNRSSRSPRAGRGSEKTPGSTGTSEGSSTPSLFGYHPSIRDFDIVKPVARGAYGSVFLARRIATGDLYALKVMKKSDLVRKNHVEHAKAELAVMAFAENASVVRLYFSFASRRHLYLVMEYCPGGDLFSLLQAYGVFPEPMARVYLAEAVEALGYLRSNGIVHRDIKPDNLLVTRKGHIKLADFGLSRIGMMARQAALNSEPQPNATMYPAAASQRGEAAALSISGTPDYLAPEVLLGTGHGPEVDLWALGVMVFEFLTGIPPFNAETPNAIFQNILARRIPWPTGEAALSDEARDLIDRLLTLDPTARLGAGSMVEVREHAFFRDVNWASLRKGPSEFFCPMTASADDTSYFELRKAMYPTKAPRADDDGNSSGSSGRSSGSSHDEPGGQRGGAGESAREQASNADGVERLLSPPSPTEDTFGDYGFVNAASLHRQNMKTHRKLMKKEVGGGDSVGGDGN